MIEKVLSRSDLSHSVRNTLNLLTKHENVPRKRPKFANFMKNVSRGTSVQDVNRVFDLIEEAFKAEKEEQATAVNGNKTNGAAEVKEEVKEESSPVKRKAEAENESTEEPAKKKKKKKAVADSETVADPVETVNGDNVDSEEPKKKKKKKDKSAEKVTEEIVEQPNENSKPVAVLSEQGFGWKEAIRSIVAEKGNSISVKKLQSKLLKAYFKETNDSETVNEQTIEIVLKRKLKKMKNIGVEDDKVVIKA